MFQEKLNTRKKIGLVLLGVVLLYWIAVPILPFTNIPNKAVVIPVLVVVDEVFLWARLRY